jgi:hypothetical protein
MIAGNRSEVASLIAEMILDALKRAITEGTPVDWSAKSWACALADFKQVSGQAADAVVQNMEDRGDVPYVKGKFTRVDQERGAELVREYLMRIVKIKGYCRRRTKMFDSLFSLGFRKLTQNWKERADVYFHVSG